MYLGVIIEHLTELIQSIGLTRYLTLSLLLPLLLCYPYYVLMATYHRISPDYGMSLLLHQALY